MIDTCKLIGKIEFVKREINKKKYNYKPDSVVLLLDEFKEYIFELSEEAKESSNNNVTTYHNGNRLIKIFDDNKECNHKWHWQRSTSKGDVLYVCDDCGAIKKEYPRDDY